MTPHENHQESEIGKNLDAIRARIRAACKRAGRDPKDVTLIAVSKLKPYEDILEARASGAEDFGENYVQEMAGKMDRHDSSENPPSIRWHMIGHLQKNKVKYLMGRAALIHSVDSVSLAEQIEREAAKRDLTVRVLMEVNAAGEASKFGFAPDTAEAAAKEIAALPHVKLLGLMTSAPPTENPESNRVFFRQLRTLALDLAAKGLIDTGDPEFPGPVLSMGMTGDFETAVEEGATMVRIGTAIFGRRDAAGIAR